MIRPIMKDQFFLSRPSQKAGPEDIAVGLDLMDTLRFHRDGCVGMAANMIGIAKRVIIFDHDGVDTVMFNPEIIWKKDAYETQEGCLSLDGVRKTTRYRSIRVKYRDMQFKQRIETYSGWTAQIIQHEIDHCNGIII